MTAPNWNTVRNMQDWMRRVEKQLAHEQRRPQLDSATALLGPGFAPTATQVFDWNQDEAIFSGQFWSDVGALNGPDPSVLWIGTTFSEDRIAGVQLIYELLDVASPRAFMRRFTAPSGSPTRNYTPWTDASSGGGVGPPGPPGPAGPPSASTLSVTAGMTVSGHRVVRAQSDGSVVYADNTTAGDITADLWLTLGAATSGGPVTVQTFGYVAEPSWSWSTGPIFLGAAGVLTQIPPTSSGGAVFIEQVATADTATALFWNPRSPIHL